MSETKVLTAAYVPFKTFLTSLDHLRNHGVPNLIDRSMFPNLSGTSQSQILSALLFLGLINEEGHPSPILHDLVMADEDARKQVLKPILEKSYANIFDEDLTRITPAQFESLFSSDIYGVSGDTRKKARSFFFFALKYADIKYSKLLTKVTRKKRKTNSNGNTNGNATVVKEEVKGKLNSDGNESKQENRIQKEIPKQKSDYEFLIGILSADMEEEEKNAVWTLIQYLKEQELQEQIEVD